MDQALACGFNGHPKLGVCQKLGLEDQQDEFFYVLRRVRNYLHSFQYLAIRHTVMAHARNHSQTDYSVIIIGAGISGINAACRIQEGLPDYSYAVLEARHEIGGTWSLFKYPGVRSDSDLYTFGFEFDPWIEGQ